MLLEDLRNAAETALVRLGKPGISVYGGEGLAVKDVLLQNPLPNPKIRKTTGGRLRAAGFDFEQTFRAGHYTVWLPDTGDETLVRLADTFDPPERNPFAGAVQR